MKCQQRMSIDLNLEANIIKIVEDLARIKTILKSLDERLFALEKRIKMS
jgi:hypothetical protein